MIGRNKEVAPHPTDVILVTDKKIGKVLAKRIRSIKPKAAIEIVDTPEKVSALNLEISPGTLLIGFGTGIIIPGKILKLLSRPAINFHAAPPEYPGRDPHHWAIYEKAAMYGVTAHEMTSRVDEGLIISVERFDIPQGIKPEALLKLANERLFELFCALLPTILEGTYVISQCVWSGKKRSRRDFVEICNLSRWIDHDEFVRRYNGFDGGKYDNLTVDIHGHKFRIEKTPSDTDDSDDHNDYDWRDFTLQAFRQNLQLAKKSYAFARFGDVIEAPHVLWRHDVDISVHQAVILAEMESEEKCKATYFVSLHSAFYNLLEPEIIALIKKIISLGHDIGLHFDAAAYTGEKWTQEALNRHAGFEKSVLENVFDQEVKSISFHNPDVGNMMAFDDDLIAGMINAYGRSLKREYQYCSDSNGYWRFEPLPKVLAESKSDKLHILTHPAMWVAKPMRPRQRIERCVIGRAGAVMRNYDQELKNSGRKNL